MGLERRKGGLCKGGKARSLPTGSACREAVQSLISLRCMASPKSSPFFRKGITAYLYVSKGHSAIGMRVEGQGSVKRASTLLPRLTAFNSSISISASYQTIHITPSHARTHTCFNTLKSRTIPKINQDERSPVVLIGSGQSCVCTQHKALHPGISSPCSGTPLGPADNSQRLCCRCTCIRIRHRCCTRRAAHGEALHRDALSQR